MGETEGCYNVAKYMGLWTLIGNAAAIKRIDSMFSVEIVGFEG